jgi:hypothetical protein
MPTVFRDKVGGLFQGAAELITMTADTRWPKAVARLKAKDWERVDHAFEAMDELKKALTESAIAASSDDSTPAVTDPEQENR